MSEGPDEKVETGCAWWDHGDCPRHPRTGNEVEEKYLLWDTRSYVGNCVLWWAPNGNGYVTDVDAAGRYSKESAERIQNGRGTDFAIPESLAVECSRRRVDVQLLRSVMEERGLNGPKRYDPNGSHKQSQRTQRQIIKEGLRK